MVDCDQHLNQVKICITGIIQKTVPMTNVQLLKTLSGSKNNMPKQLV